VEDLGFARFHSRPEPGREHDGQNAFLRLAHVIGR
jgi:hypothetical protein